MNENRNVENFVEVDDRREPAIGEKSRIRNDEESPDDFFAKINSRGEIFSADGAMTSCSSKTPDSINFLAAK